MKLISIIDQTDESIFGFVLEGDSYSYFSIDNEKDAKVVLIGRKIPSDDYDGYEHFVDVFNKFDPDLLFFKTPITIDKETYDSVVEAYNDHLLIDTDKK